MSTNPGFGVSVKAGLIYDDAAYRVILNELGLTEHAVDRFRDYSITFHLKPYPDEVENISKENYRLQLTISREQRSSFSIKGQTEIYAAVISGLFRIN